MTDLEQLKQQQANLSRLCMSVGVDTTGMLMGVGIGLMFAYYGIGTITPEQAMFLGKILVRRALEVKIP